MRNMFMQYASNKGTDQPAQSDQHLYFSLPGQYTCNTSSSYIRNFNLASVAVQAGLCHIWSQTLKTGFLMTRLIYYNPILKDYTISQLSRDMTKPTK